jgi:hypothetical protein
VTCFTGSMLFTKEFVKCNSLNHKMMTGRVRSNYLYESTRSQHPMSLIGKFLKYLLLDNNLS